MDKPNPDSLFRVIGVRIDGTHVVLADGLTKEQADSVQETLAAVASAFAHILVEFDREGPI